MEIDCPDHAIAIWLDGQSDAIAVRFPDRQIVMVESPQQLMTILKHRRVSRDRRVGTKAAPVQYDIDQIAEAIRDGTKTPESVEAAMEEKRLRERRRLLRLDAKRQALKEAEKLLAICGL